MFKMLKTLLSTKFPGVDNITVDELQLKIEVEQNCNLENESDRKNCLVILDVRQDTEYSVSHLQGSVRVDPSDVNAVLKVIPETGGVDVVCYCSLGYRSTQMVTLLKQQIGHSDLAGRLNCYNLEGGIFKWANEGHSMKDENHKDTIYVHPYNIVWQHYLKKELRKYANQNITQ